MGKKSIPGKKEKIESLERRKFLKKDSTELAEIAHIVGRFIIGNPGVEFKLFHGSRCILQASKNMKLIERILD